MAEELLWLIAGLLAGMVSGLTPGLHANTIAFLGTFAPAENRLGFAMFVVAMGVSHSFFDAIPSILLGAPSEESSVNLLPGHSMLLRGDGMLAIRLMAFGGLATGIFAIALLPVFFALAQNYSAVLAMLMPALIAATFLMMVWYEKNRTEAIIVAVASGMLGVIVLDSAVRDPVFTLVIGFFALSGLAQSVLTGAKIPEQKKEKHGKAKASTGFVSALTSGFLAIVPGIGPSQAATIVRALYRKLTEAEYLVLNGGINSGNLFFSILMLYSLGKTRTGMAAALNGIVSMDAGTTATLLATAAVAIGFSAALVPFVAERAISIMRKVDYRKAGIAIISLLTGLLFWLSGISGIAAALCAAGISLYAIGSNVKRSNCMAFLLLPTMLFYLGA